MNWPADPPLPRADDLALVPALVGEDGGGDCWDLLARCARQIPAAELIERAGLLGLALTRPGKAAPWVAPAGPARPLQHKPLILDLSVLWAGPLCGAVLAACECDVVKVELAHRRDTTALRSPAFDHDLNGTKRHLTLRKDAPGDLEHLQDLLRRADGLITNARASSLAALGIDAASTRHLVWLSISAHGPSDPRIGFGDDAAVAGGLLGRDAKGDPAFLGDAVADPLTGLAGAAEMLHALGSGRTGAIAIALSAVAAWAAQA